MKNYTIVTCAETLAQLYAHIEEFDYFAFDTETTGLNVRKDKVIGFSICGKIGTAFYMPLTTWDKSSSQLVPIWGQMDFENVLEKLGEKELLMWNGSYDVRIVKNNFNIDLTNSLLADVMLMKHTVDEEGEFGLKKVAIQLQEELGLDMETAANEEQLRLKENVAANGGSTTKTNYEMYKADLNVMGEYACSDADLTLRIAEYYKQKVEQEGQEEFLYDIEPMPLLKEVTITMEEKGIRLDLAKIEATKVALTLDMQELEKSILSQLNAIPEVSTWIKRKSLEEFPPKNKGSFAQAVCKHYNFDLPKTPAGKFSITAKTIQTLRPCRGSAFLLGNEDLLPEIAEKISWDLFVKSGQSEININSKQQLGQIVFDCLGIKPLTKTEKGAPQFNDDLIQHLVEVRHITWARDLSNYNKLVKISGTYIDRFLDEQESGRFYPSFNQHRTISGRYGSNLQQLPRPKEEGELDEIVLKYINVIREFFITDEGRAFVDVDYESLEPHVFSHVSNDDGLRDIFRNGHDFYSTIAIKTEKLIGVSADKKAENYLGKINKPKRQSAKGYSLGVPYGMKAFALGKTLGISTQEAEKLIEGYLSGFPELRAWMDRSEEQAQQYGFVKSETGRVRHLPKVKALYNKHGDELLEFMYRKKLTSQLSSKMGYLQAKEQVQNWYMDYKNGLNNAKNFQIQSLAASIVNLAAIAINRKFKELKIDAWVALNIHDQLVVDVPQDRAKECAAIVQDIMENNYKISIPLKAPAAIGYNLKDAH